MLTLILLPGYEQFQTVVEHVMATLNGYCTCDFMHAVDRMCTHCASSILLPFQLQWFQ